MLRVGLWVPDFNYVPDAITMVYAAPVIDFFTHENTRWHLWTSVTARFVLVAVNQAIGQRCLAEGSVALSPAYDLSFSHGPGEEPHLSVFGNG